MIHKLIFALLELAIKRIFKGMRFIPLLVQLIAYSLLLLQTCKFLNRKFTLIYGMFELQEREQFSERLLMATALNDREIFFLKGDGIRKVYLLIH